MEKLIEVGIKANTYRESRNFSGLSVNGFQFRKVIDLYKFPAYLYFKIFKKTHARWLNIFWRPFSKNPKIYHFFNAINCGNQPWIVTTESYLPRGAHEYGRCSSEKRYIHYSLKRLQHPSCKKIIAISEFAKFAQVEFLKNIDVNKKAIIGKIEVWHPPQKLMVNNISEKEQNEVLNFLFVGADFFRKGGLEVLLAFDKLLDEGEKVKLIIVSSLNYGDYASQSTKLEFDQAHSIIAKQNQIEHHTSLKNNEVLSLYKKADVGLLPSYEETYGYSVLEAQASGCPVITTNGTAFPEINNNECGWIINLPLDEMKRTVPRTSEARIKTKNIIVTEVCSIIKEILQNRKIVSLKGQNSIERIRNNHCPIKAADRLETLYKIALAR